MIPVRAVQHTRTDSKPYAAQEAFAPNSTESPEGKRKSNVRLTHAAIAAGLVVVLLLSWWLKPDPRGLGTHEQLMLFPCNFHALTNLPCPFCGMTTAFTHMARGNVGDALLAQPIGAVGFVATVLLLPIAVGGLVTGKDAVGKIRRLPWGRLSTVIVGLFAAAWAFKIAAIWVQ
jgi:hypothetical protein